MILLSCWCRPCSDWVCYTKSAQDILPLPHRATCIPIFLTPISKAVTRTINELTTTLMYITFISIQESRVLLVLTVLLSMKHLHLWKLKSVRSHLCFCPRESTLHPWLSCMDWQTPDMDCCCWTWVRNWEKANLNSSCWRPFNHKKWRSFNHSLLVLDYLADIQLIWYAIAQVSLTLINHGSATSCW